MSFQEKHFDSKFYDGNFDRDSVRDYERNYTSNYVGTVNFKILQLRILEDNIQKLKIAIELTCFSEREASIALQKLEECAMWARESINKGYKNE